MKTRAFDLARGDVFTFRGREYVCIVNVKNESTPNVCTLIAAHRPEPDYRKVVAMKLYPNFKVEVDPSKRVDIALEVMKNSDDEVRGAVVELERAGR